MTHIMVDLETLSTAPNAAIISIGACKFNFKTGRIGPTFYGVIEINSTLNYGMHIDSDTVQWWARQSEEARKIFETRGETVYGVLKDFKRFVGNANVANIWGNGAAFDNVILTQAYKAVGIERPWKYWGDRCYRTIKAMYPQIKPERIGVAHNALDDARTQAKHLIEIYKKFGKDWSIE